MSAWDPYIDNLISQSKKNNAENIDRAIIIDKVSGDPWTQKKSLKVSTIIIMYYINTHHMYP